MGRLQYSLCGLSRRNWRWAHPELDERIAEVVKGALEQRAVRRHVYPAAGSRRVRQRNQCHTTPPHSRMVHAPDQPIKGLGVEKAIDRQTPNGNDQRWPNQVELGVEPRRAVRLLLERWHAVSASRATGAGIASRDRRDVDLATKGRLIQTCALQPPEQRTSGAAGECATILDFALSRRLPNEHRARPTCFGDDREHAMVGVAATTAGSQRVAMRIEERREAASGHDESRAHESVARTARAHPAAPARAAWRPADGSKRVNFRVA